MTLRPAGNLDVPLHEFPRLVEQDVADYRLVLSREQLASASDLVATTHFPLHDEDGIWYNIRLLKQGSSEWVLGSKSE